MGGCGFCVGWEVAISQSVRVVDDRLPNFARHESRDAPLTPYRVLFKSVGPSVSQLQVRLARTTPRERILLAGLMVGGLLFGAVSALDFQARQQELYADALAARASARFARSNATRISQGAPDQAAIEDMRQWGLETSNGSVAQVRVESLLLDAATRARLVTPRITTDEELEEIGPTQWMTAEVETDLNWTSTFAFLDELSQLQTGFRVRTFSFDVEPSRQVLADNEFRPPRGRIRLGLAFPVSVPQGAPQ